MNTGEFLDALLLLMILTAFVMLGSGRLAFTTRVLAVQGVAVGFVPLALPGEGVTLRLVLLAVFGTLLKGLLFPQILLRTLRDAEARHETRPLVGYSLSLLSGVVLLAVCLLAADPSRLPLPRQTHSTLELPVALFTMLAGLFLIVSRNKAFSQVLGYVMLDNGLFLAGLAIAREEPFLVEMGILLDLLVAVLVMGVAISHIQRAFRSIDVDQLSTLRD